MKNRIRWLGLVLAFAMVAALLPTGRASALPPNAPKIGMICTPGTVAGATHTYNLVANTGYITTPDGNDVFMWSYANADAPDSSHFQYPGPVLCVTQGQTVVVNLSNTLPEATSIMFPGQEGVTASGGAAGLMTTEAPATTGTVSYTFTAGSPGTFIYESGSDISKQIEMGLVGALIVRPALGSQYAYDASTQFNTSREYLQLLSEIDPDLHHAVETGAPYDFNNLLNHYYAINGRAFPDTIQDNGASNLPNQPYGAIVRIQPYDPVLNPYPALIRMINVGAQNHPFHPHGNHLTEIAQDGRMLLSSTGASAATERFGETIGSGQTQDFLLPWTDQDHWNPTTNPLPVAEPNYRNLTFKDGRTWYAANPYLGYKGTLPVGTTSLNVCGEWYFPFHSHALNEFSNYDEGFGGMGTLLRVDPLGGCFAFPTSTRITTGTLNSGTFTNLGVDDANYYKVNSTTTGTRTTDWYAQFSGVPNTAMNFAVTYKGNDIPAAPIVNFPTSPVSQTVSIWNWTTSAWVPIAGPTSITSTADVSVTSAVIAAPAAYIGTGANKGLVRVRILSTRAANFVNGGNFMKLVYDAP